MPVAPGRSRPATSAKLSFSWRPWDREYSAAPGAGTPQIRLPGCPWPWLPLGQPSRGSGVPRMLLLLLPFLPDPSQRAPGTAQVPSALPSIPSAPEDGKVFAPLLLLQGQGQAEELQ